MPIDQRFAFRPWPLYDARRCNTRRTARIVLEFSLAALAINTHPGVASTSGTANHSQSRHAATSGAARGLGRHPASNPQAIQRRATSRSLARLGPGTTQLRIENIEGIVLLEARILGPLGRDTTGLLVLDTGSG